MLEGIGTQQAPPDRSDQFAGALGYGGESVPVPGGFAAEDDPTAGAQYPEELGERLVEIGLFATQLKTIDGLFVFAPNSQLWNTPVTNYTRAEERRFDLAIGIGYEDDIGKAEKILLDIAAAEARVLETPAPATFVSELGDSAVAVNLRCWMKGADWWATSRDLTKRAKLEFDANGISIPFPQRDVHYLPLDKPASGVSTASRGTKPGATRKPKAAAK